MEVADVAATSLVDLLFLYLIDEVNKLLHTHKLELVQLCENLKASDVHNIHLFSADLIKELSQCDSMLMKLSSLFTWSNHSILKALAGCYEVTR